MVRLRILYLKLQNSRNACSTSLDANSMDYRLKGRNITNPAGGPSGLVKDGAMVHFEVKRSIARIPSAETQLDIAYLTPTKILSSYFLILLIFGPFNFCTPIINDYFILFISFSQKKNTFINSFSYTQNRRLFRSYLFSYTPVRKLVGYGN